MSNFKIIVFLLLGLVATGAALALIRRSGQNRPAIERVSLIEDPDDVARIVLERGGKMTVVLQRTTEWRIVAPFEGRVDGHEVAKLLDLLSFASVTDRISDSELLKLGRTRGDFSLEQPVVRVTVSGRRGSSVIDFGAPTPSADGVYAALDGTSAVFVVPSAVFAAVDRPADAFRYREIFGFGTDSITSFDIKSGTGTIFSFVREGQGWRVGDERASDMKVRELLVSLASARASAFVWPLGGTNETNHLKSDNLAAFGLNTESAVTVVLKGMAGGDQRISFGKDCDDKLVYALVHNGSAIVTVPRMIRDLVLQKRLMFVDSRLFPVEARSVTMITIAGHDESCALTRATDGGWRLESPIVAPADGAVVDKILTRLLNLTPADVDQSGLSVSLSTNSANVKISRAKVFGDLDFKDLRAHEVMRLESGLIKRLVRTGDGENAKSASVVYSRERKVWSAESAAIGTQTDEKGVSTVLSTLNPLMAVRVEKLCMQAVDLEKYGLDRPFVTIAVDQDRADAVRRNILVGRQTDGGRFATVGSSDAVFVVSEETVRGLLAPLIGK